MTGPVHGRPPPPHTPARACNDGDTLIITLAGDVTVAHRGELVELCRTRLTEAVCRVVIDVASVDFVDLPGLRVLIHAYRTCTDHGAAFTLRHPPEHLTWLLDLTDTAELLLEHTETVEAPRSGMPDAPAPAASGDPTPSAPLDINDTDGPARTPQPPAPADLIAYYRNTPTPPHHVCPAATTRDQRADDRDRRADDRDRRADDRDRRADHRDQRADDRDQGADDRDLLADDRDLLLDERDLLLDERISRVRDHQDWEDIREDLADDRELQPEEREHHLSR